MSRRRNMKRVAQGGAGLVEVSVSMLILAIGTLGLGSLQISAKRMGYEAVQRGEAAALAMDLMERLRANRALLAAYGTTAVGEGSGGTPLSPVADCGQASCSPAELTAWDLWQWEQALDGSSTSGQAGGLVRPTACIEVNGRKVTVAIAWQGYRPLAAPLQERWCGAGHYGADDADMQWLQMTSWIGEE